MANYCLKGRELLFNLKRSEWLPPHDDEGIRIILSEVVEIQQKLESTIERYGNSIPDPLKVQLAFLHQSLSRNHRYLNSYSIHRLSKIRELRWEVGAVLPDQLKNTFSNHEKEYFNQYNNLINDVNEAIELDLTGDMEPPKDLYIEIRVLVDCGKVMTDSGPISLDAGSIQYVKRSQVESLIREGKVEHIKPDAIF